ncbi:MAG TPA: 5-formyltetrahydrofolate cyclo-ligase [Bradyrhizobium sp.]|jgi:5-formyltetrahydrofolate cyclo-ligase
MSSPLVSPDAQKATLRAAALAARDALNGELRAAAAQAVAARGLPFELAPGAVVAGYSPIRSEIDPLPLMRGLAAQRAQLALPLIVARDQPLQFRVWAPGNALRRGPLGILEPPFDAGEIIPDILLVPLAAFDRAGHRIGYGAGHYDRTLAQLRAARKITAIGLAFAAQEIPYAAGSARDARLDLVLTENETIEFRS